MPATHKRYGGSTIARTINCTYWRQAADKMPPQGSSEFADRGTLLHDAMEEIMLADEGFDPKSVIGNTYEGIELTKELYNEKIIPAMAAVEAIFNQYNVEDYTCEEAVQLADDLGGTADMLARGSITLDGMKCNVALCVDFKFGDGIVVSAENNEQGLFYSTCASVTPETQDLFDDIDLLVVGIIQPTSHAGEDYSLWEVEPGSMDDMEERAFAARDKAESDDPGEPNPGSWCAFCPNAPVCPAKTGELAALKRVDLALIESFPTFDQIKSMKDTIKAMEAFAHEQLEEGVDIPGYKLVAKRAQRVYTDQAAVEEKIKHSKKIKKDDAYTYKVKTPAQLEKVCKEKGVDYKKVFGEFVASVSSGTTLASENDKRDAIVPGNALKQLVDRL
tara:strand:- start:503 stop:1672 length:1170 start_codon:yes stop_codon:yes gene_type:complete